MAELELEMLQGAIAAVVYQNYDNGYAVLRLKCQDGQTVTVVGTIPMPAVGEGLLVTGKWTSHSSYGRQFEAEFLERLLPQSSTDILAYLSSRIIKGIGPVTAGRIVSHFGDRTLDIMEREPQRLSEVPGISAAKARAIGEEFRLRIGMRQLLEFFTAHLLAAELAARMYKLFGDSAMEIVYDDPYVLMEEGLEAPFGAVDRFAIELGIAGDDPKRVEAGVLFELNYNLSAGHSFLPEDKLLLATAQLLSVGEDVVLKALDRLMEYEQVVRQTLADIQVVYLTRLHEAEVYIQQRLIAGSRLEFAPVPGLKTMLLQAQQESGLEYSEQQAQAVCQAADCGVLLVTGGPGTGKTTILRGVLSLFDQMGLKTLLAAPTGRAAQRLTEVTGRDASTIHRLLEASIDPNSGKMVFLKDENDPLKADAVIVDEMSMVDVLLLHSLLRAVRPETRLIFVGDPDQLPPVGPGSPFADCLRSKNLPAVRLTEIFRQARESLIVMNAHRINSGVLPDLKNVKSDLFFRRSRSDEEVGRTIAELCCKRLPQNMGIPAGQIQVLTPTRKSGVGTWALNQRLQNTLNPAAPTKKERQWGDFSFREGDRVMQIRNNYDIMWRQTDGTAVGTGIFNGDVGIIRAIDPQQETLTVVFDDREAEYDFTQLGELEPAYAMTVHKSQGSEYRAVVLAAWTGSPYLLSRSVLYTAVTRARELLVIVGREEIIGAMTENAKINRRYTGLKLRLQGKVQ